MAFIALFPSKALAQVFVHDAIELKGKETMLTAETSGRYFSKGGQMVEFFVSGKTIGRVLSGGDGIAYKAFTPRTHGTHIITAKSGKHLDRGILISLRRGSRVVLIDVEGSLLSSPFASKPVAKSKDVIKKIMKKYPVAYVHTGALGIKPIKEWLRENDFPEAAVVPWQAGNIFSDLSRKKLKIKAVIGNTAFIESAADYKPEIFSFEELTDAEKIKKWEEIGRQLRPAYRTGR